MTTRPIPQLRAARVTVVMDLPDGPVCPSAAHPDARVKVERLEYEADLTSNPPTEELFASGRPTQGRRGTARSGALISDETVASITDDQRAMWIEDARRIVPTLPATRDVQAG